MSRRASVYLTSAAIEALQLAPGDSLSGRINAVATRYAAIVRESCPTLEPDHWRALCVVLRDDSVPLAVAWADLEASPHGALGRAMRAMPYAAQAAAAEVCGRVNRARAGRPIDAELLRQCGARMPRGSIIGDAVDALADAGKLTGTDARAARRIVERAD
jgi:hypothetical protein